MTVLTRKSIRPRAFSYIFALLFSIVSMSTIADGCKKEIKRKNIIGNALFTTLFRSINGKLNSWEDLRESLTYGAGAGYLFYKSREMIGNGDESRGLATAYLASSVTENVTLGHHPLSHLRYGIGPMEVRWATPFAPYSENKFNFSINAFDAFGALSAAVSGKAKDFKLKNGILTATDNSLVGDGFHALAREKTVITRPGNQSDQGLWHHELIHTTQYIQFSSFGSTNLNILGLNDSLLPSDLLSNSSNTMSVRIEWFNALVNAIDQNRDYEDRWMEIEAAKFGQDSSPLHNDDGSCSAQLSFQFQL
ncbi:hypothetical protein [Aurantivibrio infirmus]